MSNELKTISLDGFSKNVIQYVAGENITFTTDSQDSNKKIISAVAADLSNYYTKSETYSKTEVNELIDAIEQFEVEIVQTLPATGEAKTIYLVPKQGGGYSEYLYINNAWEEIGDTSIDLTDYYNKTETDALLDEKQDTLTAGSNITIAQDGTISATDTTYNNATQNDAGLMSAADKTKLDGIEAGAEANVQSDWDQSDTTADDFIKNKPDLSVFLTCTDLEDCQTISDMQDDIDSKQDALTAGDYISIAQDGTISATYTKAQLLTLLGYEEVSLSMTDTDGNSITKTILAAAE